MKKKLLIINPNQFGYSSGHMYYCKYLKNDFDIDYFCFDKNLNKIQMEGVKVYYLSYTRNKILRLIRFLWSAILITYKYQYSLIFVVRFKLVFFIGLFSKCKKKIIDIRSGDLSDNRLIRRYRNTMTKFSTIPFDKVTVLSESLKKLLKLNESKVKTIPLGSIEFSSKEKTYDTIQLLYVGSLNKRRIEDTVIGLSKFYSEYHEQIKIFYNIIGFGKNEKEIVNLIKEEKMEDVIKFHGRKHYNQLGEFFDKANIGVCYIPITDFFDIQPPTKLFEYALSGLFTIATATKENAKYIDSKNGILCNDSSEGFYEALKEVYKLRNSINSNEIKNSLKDYHWEKIVNNSLKPLLLSEM